MGRIILVTGVVAALSAVPAAAQTTAPRFYVGGSTGADVGWRGPIPGGAVPSAGGLFGVRITDAWSVEVEIERGFRTTGSTREAVWISFAPPGSTREEIERLGIRARFEWTQKAGPGFSVHALWQSRAAGRVNAGLFAGISARAYDSRTIRTVTFIPPEANLSPDRQDLRPSDSTRHMAGGGLTGGLLVFVRLAPALTVAPELRCTTGLITDDPYRVFRTGVRLMWSF